MSKKKIIATCVAGNALEFYDFTLYGVFAVILSQHFFPSSDPLVSILSSWGAFAAGFIMRPFGAGIFGYIGDKYGRKVALSLSILGMGIPTFLIGLLPSYDYLGVFAPILLVFFRLIQGLCTGGEYNGAAIFALEHVGKDKPGFYGGLITGSCVIGALTATFLGMAVLKSSDPSFFWRFTFIFGGAVSFIASYLRKKIAESPEFLHMKKIKPEKTNLDKMAFLISFLIGALNGALSYTIFGFLNSYLKSYIGFNLVNAFYYNLIGLTCFMLSAPLLGLLMDKIGRSVYFYVATVFVAVSVSMSFYMIQSGMVFNIIIAQIMLGIATGSIAGPQHAFVQKLFPTQLRYKYISISFCLGMAICGGTAPMVYTYLIEKTSNLYIPAIYISSLAVLLLFSLLFKRNNNHKNVVEPSPIIA